LLDIVALAALTNRLTAKTWVLSRRCLRKSYRVHRRLIGLHCKTLIGWVREGDLVVVHSIDRLARNLQDLLSIVSQLNGKGVSIQFIKDNLTFPPQGTDGASKLYLSILGAVAEFERSIIKQRQREGIDKAKAKGVYKGRKPTIDKDRILALRDEGHSTYNIAEVMGISRMTVHRALNG